MDGKLSIGPDSKFRLKKCTTIHHDKADRISQLPDEVIHTILSLLPLREAVATSILSRRWPNLWKHRCNLIFEERSLKLNTRDKMTNLEGILWDAKKCKYIAMVNSVLQSHAALSLKVFAVSFYVNKSAHDVISEWLEFAFSRQVEMLDLDFHCRGGPLLVVLEEIFRGSKISPISFKSLKTLCLRSFKVSGEDIKLFLCSCPVLERLILQNTFLTSDVEVSGATLRLNHLDLAESSSSRGSVIRVSAPNLTWLGLDDSSPGKLFLDRNTTPKIVGASLVHCSRNPDVVQRLTSFVSCFISQLKTLSLKIVFPEVFLANRFPELPNLSKLEIKYVGRYQQCIMHVSALIWTFPNLQEFRLKFMNIFGTPRVAGVETTTAVRCSRHHHVRVFEFVGFHADTESHKQMVAYMVNSCVALRKVIVGYQPCRLDSSESRHESVTPEVYAEQKLLGLVPNHIQLQLYNHIIVDKLMYIISLSLLFYCVYLTFHGVGL